MNEILIGIAAPLLNEKEIGRENKGRHKDET